MSAVAGAGRLRVLLVDDSPCNLRWMAAALEEAGHDVMRSDGLVDALSALEVLRPHVVLIDIAMVSLDGGRLARLLDRTLPSLAARVLLCSCLQPAVLADLARRIGAHGVLVKSTDSLVFLQQFEAAIADLEVQPECTRETASRTG